ncbi:LysR family transcriptional regulator [Pandoraea commovens]|uniref:LysR family transcriptional regulator n=1 Tax=Pandoraea commovens TaxID=2508289 RepID=A0ABY5QFQ4_9BURK|nr:LysR family transcriptional regulator [Pandoraea commovens]UVA79641.1 LysR family transcriptional regulator [Pandoraea commovens]
MNARAFDLTQLRTFIAIHDAGSISAAAEQIFLSQSTVSEQLKKLEERAGQPLLVRSRKGMRATPAGTRLLAYARQIAALSEAAFEDLQGVLLDGELRIAITDYYRPHDVARVLKRFTSLYPRLRLHVSAMQSSQIERSAMTGEHFDVGLALRLMNEDVADGTAPHDDLGGASATLVRRERLVWAMAATQTAPVDIPLPLVTLPRTCALQTLVASVLERHKVAYRVSHSAAGVAGMQLALAAGLGVSCLNESALTPELIVCPPSLGLPPLPRAEFHLLPGRADETDLIRHARNALLRLFA